MSEANGGVPKRFMFRGRQPWPAGSRWVNCTMCAHAWATAVDHLCTRCAFIETGLPEEFFGDWKQAQFLYQRGMLQVTRPRVDPVTGRHVPKRTTAHPAQGEIGREASAQEDLDKAETIVRNTFGKQEVERLAKFTWEDKLDREADKEYPQRGKADKELLAKTGDQFTITEARFIAKTGKMKADSYVLDIENDGALQVLWFSTNPAGKRGMKLASLVEHFQQPTPETVKAYLRSYDTDFGNAGFDIEFVEG